MVGDNSMTILKNTHLKKGTKPRHNSTAASRFFKHLYINYSGQSGTFGDEDYFYMQVLVQSSS